MVSIFRRTVSAAALLALIVLGSASWAQNYVPAETRVAILPVVNASGEKDGAQAEKQARAASDELNKQFASRGFTVVDDKAVSDAIAGAGIQLTDEEQRSSASYLRIGADAKADLVVMVVIEKVSQKINRSFFTVAFEGRARITLAAYDVKKSAPFIKTTVKEVKAGAGEIVATTKGSANILAACGKAVREVLDAPLKPYPASKQSGR
jgi:TolB-like protein